MKKHCYFIIHEPKSWNWLDCGECESIKEAREYMERVYTGVLMVVYDSREAVGDCPLDIYKIGKGKAYRVKDWDAVGF